MSTITIPPARVGDSIQDIDTPALILDLDTFEFNLAELKRTLQTAPQVKVRSHAKAHKCPAIALLQIQSGAVGVCCQKVSEAEVMAQSGVRDVFVSNEVVGKNKLRRLCALTRLGTNVSVAVDCKYNIDELLSVAEESNCLINVLVEVDVGGKRCGVPPADAAELVSYLVSKCGPQLAFKGLHCYHGGNQHIRLLSDREKAVQEVCEKVQLVLDDLARRSLPKPEIITGAGTGTYPYEVKSGLYNEIQPGSYVFMDVDYGRNQAQSDDRFASFKQSLFVLSTVMSEWKSQGRVVVYAGIKAFALDSGVPVLYSYGGLDSKPIEGIEYVPAGDEHGKLMIRDNANVDAVKSLHLGAKVPLAPDHCDPTVNLYDFIVAVRIGRVEAVWPVAARGPGN